jgi:transposase
LDLFGKTGRRWFVEQSLHHDERRSVEALVRQLDFHGQQLKVVDAELARGFCWPGRSGCY